MTQQLLGDFAKMLSFKIVLSCFLVSIVWGKPNLSEEKDVCEKGHNDMVYRKCLDGNAILTMASLIDPSSLLTEENYKKTFCKIVDEINLCVKNEGGFCQDQSQVGPFSIKFAEKLCSDDKLFTDMWKLIKILDKPESVQRIADEFRTCIKKELEIDAANIDELEKLFAPTEEKYANAAYGCIIVTALEVLEPELIGSTGRVFSAYYKSFGFDVADALMDALEESRNLN